MKRSARNTVIAAAAAVALTLVTAVPAAAYGTGGYRSCTAPKSVSVTTVTTGSYGNHTYVALNQVFQMTNPNPGVAFAKTTYGAAVATNWTVYSNGPFSYASASCV